MWVRGWETDIHAALGQALLMSRWRRWRFYPVCFIYYDIDKHMGKLCVSYFDIFVQVWMNKFSQYSSQFHKSLNVIEEEGKKGHISRFVEFIYTTRVTLFGLERWCYNFTIIIPLLWPSHPRKTPPIIILGNAPTEANLCPRTKQLTWYFTQIYSLLTHRTRLCLGN